MVSGPPTPLMSQRARAYLPTGTARDTFQNLKGQVFALRYLRRLNFFIGAVHLRSFFGCLTVYGNQ